jgi:hypothetical protein
MFDNLWSGFTLSIFTATRSSLCSYCFVSTRVGLLLVVSFSFKTKLTASSLFQSLPFRRSSILSTPFGIGNIFIRNDCKQHIICCSFCMVLVYYPSWISSIALFVADRSFPFPHSCHWAGICVESCGLSFWIGLECFTYHGTYLL